MLQIVLPAIAAFGVLMVFYGLARSRQPEEQVQERIDQYVTRPKTLEEIELEAPFSERVLLPMIHGVAGLVTRFAPQKSMENISHKLELAGNPNDWGPSEFLGVRGLASILLGVLTYLLTNMAGLEFSQKILFSAVLAALGFQLPILWLGSKIKQRKHDIIKSLPDALDLLTISVEAGLGFDAALSRVTEKWDNELCKEFGRVLTEMQMGKLRREALSEMGTRCEVPDLTNFVAAVVQADQLGVSMARVLRVQSEQMRIKRRQRAEELAQMAPVKMTIPLVMLIFPALLVVILGPAVPKIAEAFGINIS
jgi:tight adherence protein C